MPPVIYLGNKRILTVKTIGRETSCDLVIEHTTTSRQHAHVELTEDGCVWVVDADSRNGTFLNRNDAWIRILRARLCTGDRIRFGVCQVPLQKLTDVFGKRANVRLGEQHFPLRQGQKVPKTVAGWGEPGHSLQKPKRNELTGLIEEDHL